jgi:hypothetical protein
LRQHGVLWSLAVGASVKRCVQRLTKLYDRALRHHAAVVGVATAGEAEELFASCDRSILLTSRRDEETPQAPADGARAKRFALHDPEVWSEILESLAPRR